MRNVWGDPKARPYLLHAVDPPMRGTSLKYSMWFYRCGGLDSGLIDACYE